MERKLKMLIPAIAVLLGCVTSAVSAATCGEPECEQPAPEPRCPPPAPEPECPPPAPPPACPPKKPCCPPPAGKFDSCECPMPARIITPNAGPRVCMGADVFVTADFILWTPREEGLEYAMTGANAPTSQGSLREPDFGLEPGFKVGLGLNLGHDGWDIFAEYTWLRSDVDDSVRSSTMDWLWRDGVSPDRADARWDFHFNVIDLELGRNFFVSQYLTLRPHYGFKGTWQDQDYTSRAEFLNAAGDVTLRNKMVQDFDYWGFGIRTGLDTAWHFSSSWSIFGNFAISALWSGFDIDRKDTQFSAVADTTITQLNTENNFHTILPVLELAIGLRWETWFSDDDYHFGIDAGWEEQVWWGMNRLIVRQQPQRDNGDLTLQGFTLKFRFDF